MEEYVAQEIDVSLDDSRKHINDNNDMGQDYQRFQLLNKRMFTVTSLELSSVAHKTASDGKTLSVISIVIGTFLVIFFWQFENIKKLLPLPSVFIIVAYWVFAIFVTCCIVSIVCFNAGDKIRQKTESQDGNLQFNLGQVWGIKPGSIEEESRGKVNTVRLCYETDTIILKGVMKGIIDNPDDGDVKHYSCLAKIQDICAREGYIIHAIDMPYDTRNDNIWNREIKNIATSNISSEFTEFRTNLAMNVKRFTKDNSTVMVKYYFIRSTLASKRNLVEMAQNIISKGKESSMDIRGINISEFKSILESYYGLDISFDDISQKVYNTVNLGDTKIIKVIDINDKVLNYDSQFEFQIPTRFITIGFNSEDFDQDNTDKDVNGEINHDMSIFNRDFI